MIAPADAIRAGASISAGPRTQRSFYVRLSITDRCNLRCVYCLPADARFAATRASPAELMRLAELVARAVPVRKVRITGGEPTLSPELIAHVRHARTLSGEVGMTSNGILLEAYLPGLRDAGLERINISLDALDADSFRSFSRRDGLPRVIAAIRAAKRLGFAPVKINAVAMAGTDFAGLVRFSAWEGVHVRFIELMAIGEARSLVPARVTAQQMRERLAAAGITLQERAEADEPTARVWAISGHALSECSVGFITTVSAPFCATCDRIRLSSQGKLFTCLMDDRGHDLLAPLRAGDEAGVISVVSRAIAGKRPPSTFVRLGTMAEIGG